VKKPKLDRHYGQCHASFTCIDCSATFAGPSQWKGHTTCITEAEKYQKSLYKGAKKVCVCSRALVLISLLIRDRTLDRAMEIIEIPKFPRYLVSIINHKITSKAGPAANMPPIMYLELTPLLWDRHLECHPSTRHQLTPQGMRLKQSPKRVKSEIQRL
jgi:hypothetical protein